MAIYSLAVRTTIATSAAASLELIAAVGNPPKIMEIGVMLNAGTQTVLGLGTPSGTTSTPTSPVTVLPEDTANTSTGLSTVAVAWSVVPSVPANFLRRVNLNATIGAGIVLTFPRGIGILKGTKMVLWNLALNSLYDAWIVLDE